MVELLEVEELCGVKVNRGEGMDLWEEGKVVESFILGRRERKKEGRNFFLKKN